MASNVTLNWTNPVDTATVRITRSIDGGEHTNIENKLVSTVGSASYTDLHGQNDVDNIYTIYPSDSEGNEQTAITVGKNRITIIPNAILLDKPTNLIFSNATPSSVTLSFTKPANASETMLYTITKITGGTATIPAPSPSISTNITGLEESSNYTFRVTAHSTDGIYDDNFEDSGILTTPSADVVLWDSSTGDNFHDTGAGPQTEISYDNGRVQIIKSSGNSSPTLAMSVTKFHPPGNFISDHTYRFEVVLHPNTNAKYIGGTYKCSYPPSSGNTNTTSVTTVGPVLVSEMTGNGNGAYNLSFTRNDAIEFAGEFVDILSLKVIDLGIV